MANAENPAVVRLKVVMSLGTEEVLNVLHVSRPAPVEWTGALIVQAAQVVYDAYEAFFLPSLSSALTLERVEGVQVAGPGSFMGTYTDSSRPQGLVLGDCLPFNCAACLTMRTGLSGRSFNGRIYLPGIPEASQANSRLLTAAAGAIDAAGEAVRGALNTDGFVLGVFSRISGGVVRDTGVFTPATLLTLSDDVIDSQRGRSPRK